MLRGKRSPTIKCMSNSRLEFDAFATRYEEALSRGLGINGEDSAFLISDAALEARERGFTSVAGR